MEEMAARAEQQREARQKLISHRREVAERLDKEIGREMLPIIRPRQSKKTQALIRLAASIDHMGGCAYIVSPNLTVADYTANLAREMGAKIRNPITFSSLAKRRQGEHITHLLFDDVDVALRQMAHGAIPIAMTMTRPTKVMRRSIRVPAIFVDSGDELDIDVGVILRGEEVTGHIPEAHITHVDGPVLTHHVLAIRNGLEEDVVRWMLLNGSDIEHQQHDIRLMGLNMGLHIPDASIGQIVGYAIGVIDGSMQWSDLA
jgi:hypothetical protein